MHLPAARVKVAATINQKRKRGTYHGSSNQ